MTQNSKPSPFYDQGATHTFSDWLVTSLWRVGVDNPDEYYIGVLPDVSAVIDRDEGRRSTVHWDQINELNKSKLSPLGEVIQKSVRGRHFIDLCSGRLHSSVLPRVIGESFGALSYMGIDSNHGVDSQIVNEFQQNGFSSEFVKQDVREFLKTVSRKGPSVFYLAGVEADGADAASVKAELLTLLENVATSDDFVIVGPGTTDFDLTDGKFKKIANDHYHFVFRRKRDGMLGGVLDLLP